MFHLKPRVHFDEVEVPVTVEKKFDRSGIRVSGGGDSGARGIEHALSCIFGKHGAGGFFDDLLPVELKGTVALSERDGVSVFVGEHLDFDVTDGREVFFHIHLSVGERAARFLRGVDESILKLAFTSDETDPFSAASR